MKIISINSKLTESKNKITFNIDRDPTDFESNEITTKKFYGDLAFNFTPGCLTLTIKPGETEIDNKTINKINKKLTFVQQQQEKINREHKDMVESVAESTGLPID